MAARRGSHCCFRGLRRGRERLGPHAVFFPLGYIQMCALGRPPPPVSKAAPRSYTTVQSHRGEARDMGIVVVRSPKCLRGLLRRLFGLKG